LNTTLRSFAIAAALLGAVSPRALLGQTVPVKIDPSWMTVKAADSSVQFTLVAGMTPVNGGMNFNGATAGGLTLTIPVRWHVTLQFRNDDPNMPHSALVIALETPVPAAPRPEPAFPGAVSKDATMGVGQGAKQELRFTADRAGSYMIVCAVPGHGAAGMWIRLVVSGTATKPGVSATPAP